MKKKILVTGASGYIGKHLVKKLLKKDYQVTALVRDLSSVPSWLKNNQQVILVKGDLNNQASLKKALKGAGIVFHLAAALNIFEKNNQLKQTNIQGLKNLLLACKQQNRPLNFIFASSIDAQKRNSDYAKSKLKGEKIVKDFSLQNPQIKYLSVRIGNVYQKQAAGMVQGIVDLINQNNWKSSVLYHSLANKNLYLIEMDNLTNKLVELINPIDNPQTVNRTIALVDQQLTVSQLVVKLKKQKIIKSYPQPSPFNPLLLQIWQFLARLLKRGDLLIYLSLEK